MTNHRAFRISGLLAVLFALSFVPQRPAAQAQEPPTDASAQKAAEDQAAAEKAAADTAAAQKAVQDQVAADTEAAAKSAAEKKPEEKPDLDKVAQFSLPGDEVTLKNGSLIIGKIVRMTEESLFVTTPSTDKAEIKIAWADVVSIKTVEETNFELQDGTVIRGMAQPAGPGRIDIRSKNIEAPSTVSLANVKAINPPEKKAVTYTGSIGLGLSVNRGNTNTRNFAVIGLFVARSERQRLTFRGAYNYSADEEGMTAQNGMASLDYNFFITKRLYVFVNGLVEHDKFQNLELRTAVGAGPGFQFIDKGDFKPDWVKELQLYGEVGVAYLSEQYYDPPNKKYVSGRWAITLNWPFIPDRLTFFHHDEGYPSIESPHDLYVTTETGLRINIWAGFAATLQYNWRWNSTPSPGFKKVDTQFLATLGYNFEL